MTVEIRPTNPDEYRAAAGATRIALLEGPPDDEAWAKQRGRWETLRSFSAWEDGRCVGHVASFDVDTVVPGGARLGTAAVTSAGVLPTHVRRGIFRDLMGALTDDARARGLPLMSLRASEATIYERFGYGLAGNALGAQIDVARVRPLRGAANGTFELLAPDTVLDTVRDIYERTSDRPGRISRPAWLWERYFENAVAGHSSESVVAHRSVGGVLDGYAHYEVTWSDDLFGADHGTGKVHEVWATDPAAEIALWGFLFDINLMRRFTVDELAIDSVIFTSSADARAVRVTGRWDEQWLRLLDLEPALTARSWSTADDVVISVEDPKFPSQDGRWRVGSGRAERTDAAPDLVTGVAGVSAAYLGSTSWWELVATGRATPTDATAAARADAVFASRPLAFSGTFSDRIGPVITSSDAWIGFDADDTLWHNESYFIETYELFADVAAPYLTDLDDPGQAAHDLLIATETVNIPSFGYGIKGATISMIEAAITASDGTIPAAELMRLIDRAKAMMDHPVEFLDGAVEALDALSHHRLILLTKGDLKDQHRKIDASALAERFDAIEILHEKDDAAYLQAFARHGIDPEHFVMIGNSLKSDIIPILGLGGWAVHVPYETTWAIEHAEEPEGFDRFRVGTTLYDVPAIVEACLATREETA